MRQILEATGQAGEPDQDVTDRPGHDRRYALSSEKLMRETGWTPQMEFEEGLARTIDWYRANGDWVRGVKSERIPHLLRAQLRKPAGKRPASSGAAADRCAWPSMPPRSR